MIFTLYVMAVFGQKKLKYDSIKIDRLHKQLDDKIYSVNSLDSSIDKIDIIHINYLNFNVEDNFQKGDSMLLEEAFFSYYPGNRSKTLEGIIGVVFVNDSLYGFASSYSDYLIKEDRVYRFFLTPMLEHARAQKVANVYSNMIRGYHNLYVHFFKINSRTIVSINENSKSFILLPLPDILSKYKSVFEMHFVHYKPPM